MTSAQSSNAHPIRAWQILATLVMVALLAACGASTTGSGTSPTSAPAKTLQVGLMAATKGAYLPYGVSMSNGAKMAADAINAAGGINAGGTKYTIALQQVESGGTGNTAVTALQSLLDGQVNLVVGVSASGEAAGIEPIVAKNDMALVGAGIIYNGPLFHGGKAVRLLDPIALLDQGQAGVAPTAHKVAILTNTGNAGVANNTANFVQYVTKNGGTVVLNDSYAPTATDFTSQLTRIKALGADLIQVRGLFADPLYIAKQASDLGMSDVRIVSDTAGSQADIAKVVDPAKLGNLQMFTNLTTEDLAGSGNSAAQKFYDSYKARFPDAAASYAIQGHDAVYILAAAIEKANSVQPADVTKAFYALSKNDKLMSQLLLPVVPFSTGKVFDVTFGGLSSAFSLRSFSGGQLKVDKLVKVSG